jgi:hypothetical protein
VRGSDFLRQVAKLQGLDPTVGRVIAVSTDDGIWIRTQLACEQKALLPGRCAGDNLRRHKPTSARSARSTFGGRRTLLARRYPPSAAGRTRRSATTTCKAGGRALLHPAEDDHQPLADRGGQRSRVRHADHRLTARLSDLAKLQLPAPSSGAAFVHLGNGELQRSFRTTQIRRFPA